jgi:F0F1-type ATP synthase delta subunit
MFYSSRQIAKDLTQILEKQPNQAEKIADELINFCQENRRLFQLPKIIKHLKLWQTRQMATRQLTLILNHKLNETTINQIKARVGAPAGATANIVEDTGLQGGFVAKYGGKVYNGSVINQLNKLKARLIN